MGMPDDIVTTAVERLRELSVKDARIRLFPPTDMRTISRSTGKLPGRFDQHLLSFYRQSNGASVLDYCILGCKNRFLPDIAEHTLNLWATNNLLALNFVAFMTTSAGQEFGYLRECESDGSYVVAVLPEWSSGGILPIASSVDAFLATVTAKVAVTVAGDPLAIYIDEPPDWPYDLGDWFRRDAELRRRYRRGDFDIYWAGDRELEGLVTTTIGDD